jgi:hypothetical protein
MILSSAASQPGLPTLVVAAALLLYCSLPRRCGEACLGDRAGWWMAAARRPAGIDIAGVGLD